MEAPSTPTNAVSSPQKKDSHAPKSKAAHVQGRGLRHDGKENDSSGQPQAVEDGGGRCCGSGRRGEGVRAVLGACVRAKKAKMQGRYRLMNVPRSRLIGIRC